MVRSFEFGNDSGLLIIPPPPPSVFYTYIYRPVASRWKLEAPVPTGKSRKGGNDRPGVAIVTSNVRGKNGDAKPGYLSASIYPIIPGIIPSTSTDVRK